MWSSVRVGNDERVVEASKQASKVARARIARACVCVGVDLQIPFFGRHVTSFWRGESKTPRRVSFVFALEIGQPDSRYQIADTR